MFQPHGKATNGLPQLQDSSPPEYLLDAEPMMDSEPSGSPSERTPHTERTAPGNLTPKRNANAEPSSSTPECTPSTPEGTPSIELRNIRFQMFLNDKEKKPENTHNSPCLPHSDGADIEKSGSEQSGQLIMMENNSLCDSNSDLSVSCNRRGARRRDASADGSIFGEDDETTGSIDPTTREQSSENPKRSRLGQHTPIGSSMPFHAASSSLGRRLFDTGKPTNTPLMNRPIRIDNPYTPLSHRRESKGKEPCPFPCLHPDRMDKDYESVSSLGSGKFGQVLLLRNRVDGLLYAAKKTKKKSKYRGTIRELQIHTVVHQHENVVGHFTCWQDNDHYYLIMEYCIGGCVAKNLEALISRNERYSEKQMMHMAKHLLSGLDHIHSLGFIHGDIKPANIFIQFGPDRFPNASEEFPLYKIGDFGHANKASRYFCEGDSNYRDLFNPCRPGNLTDIYSAAVTLVECINQKNHNPPFSLLEHMSRSDALNWAEAREIDNPPEDPKCLSEDFLKLLKLMAHPEEGKRPTAKAALKELAILEGTDVDSLKAEIDSLKAENVMLKAKEKVCVEEDSVRRSTDRWEAGNMRVETLLISLEEDIASLKAGHSEKTNLDELTLEGAKEKVKIMEADNVCLKAKLECLEGLHERREVQHTAEQARCEAEHARWVAERAAERASWEEERARLVAECVRLKSLEKTNVEDAEFSEEEELATPIESIDEDMVL